MIFDCFTFNKEFDVLDIRKNELSGLDIKHVLVEGAYTFRGNIKPLYYSDSVMKGVVSGVDCFLVDRMPNNGNAWDNERCQRNAIMNALQTYNPSDDDIVIISDVDEIPRKTAVESYRPEMGLTSLTMDVYYYKLNCLCATQDWNHPKILTYGMIKGRTPDEIRNAESETFIPNGGWHFSYIGDEKFVIDKIKSFSHSEYDVESNTTPEIVKAKMDAGLGLWGDSEFKFLQIHAPKFPEYLVDNLQKFKHIIK